MTQEILDQLSQDLVSWLKHSMDELTPLEAFVWFSTWLKANGYKIVEIEE